MTRTLRQHTGSVGVCALDPDADVPDWIDGPLTAVVRTPNELSVLCAADAVPADIETIGPYAPFEVEGPLDPTLVGVLAGLLDPLAEKGISVLTVSTFGTDWVLVPADQAGTAADAWRQHGHRIQGAHA